MLDEMMDLLENYYDSLCKRFIKFTEFCYSSGAKDKWNDSMNIEMKHIMSEVGRLEKILPYEYIQEQKSKLDKSITKIENRHKNKPSS